MILSTHNVTQRRRLLRPRPLLPDRELFLAGRACLFNVAFGSRTRKADAKLLRWKSTSEKFLEDMKWNDGKQLRLRFIQAKSKAAYRSTQLK